MRSLSDVTLSNWNSIEVGALRASEETAQARSILNAAVDGAGQARCRATRRRRPGRCRTLSGRLLAWTLCQARKMRQVAFLQARQWQ